MQAAGYLPKGQLVFHWRFYPSRKWKEESDGESDFSLMSAGAPLDMKRKLSTSSSVESDDRYGAGWTLARWGRTLVLDQYGSSGTVLANRDGGTALAMRTDGSGTLKTTPYDGLELKADAGGWRLVDRISGEIEKYDSAGKLLAYSNISGATVNLRYSDATTSKRLPLGRAFSLK